MFGKTHFEHLAAMSARLARSVTDERLAGRFRELAAEYNQQALEASDDPADDLTPIESRRQAHG
jgi:hypothetical protein